MVDVKISSDVEEVLGAVADSLDPTVAKAVLKAANFAGGAIAEEVTNEFSGGRGNLARSFLPARFVSTDVGIGAGALSDLPYADVQDRGGTITPREKQFLAIPLDKTAGERVLWPRDRNDLFPWVNKKTGNLFLATTVGKRLKIEYLLKESVTIKPTHYLGRASKKTEPVATAIVDEAIQGSIGEADK